jgi:hypothetical protein
MAHYAELDENNKVINVVKVNNDYDDEVAGQNYLNNVCLLPGRWVKTSFNTYQGKHRYGGTPFRGNYAKIGGYYDEVRDIFLDRKPYPSWVLDDTTYTWEPPVPKPNDIINSFEQTPTSIPGQLLTKIQSYIWNESIVNWELKYIERLMEVPLD